MDYLIIYLREERSDPNMVFVFRFLVMSFLIYILLDIISEVRNCIF